MFFDDVQHGAPDVMFELKVQADGDTSPNKVDLGVGIYRNEQGVYHEMKALKDAKDHLAAINPNHDYEVTTGNADYVRNAARVAFGDDAKILEAGQVASVQTISGTGAIHIGLMFLSHSVSGLEKTVYVGTPTWGNYQPMCKIAGLQVKTYRHYNPMTGRVDWESVLEAVRSALPGSIFVLQACCHNPTAADFSPVQWWILAEEMKKQSLFPLFDLAYQGLGNSLDEDAFGLRHFVDQGFELLACQTFSKNFGLYGERVGALHAVCHSAQVASAVHDQLRFLIRSEFSSSPAYGARLVNLVLSDPNREICWRKEVYSLNKRLHNLREMLFNLLSNIYKTPGDWRVITQGIGLFSLLPLTPAQCEILRTKYHIYLVPNGRITIPGLNKRNITYVAASIDEVVRASAVPVRTRI